MKHTIKLPGSAALTVSPTIHEGGPAVFIDLKKFGMSLAQFHIPAHEGLAMADVLAEVSAEAEALMRGAGQAAGARIPVGG